MTKIYIELKALIITRKTYGGNIIRYEHMRISMLYSFKILGSGREFSEFQRILFDSIHNLNIIKHAFKAIATFVPLSWELHFEWLLQYRL